MVVSAEDLRKDCGVTFFEGLSLFGVLGTLLIAVAALDEQKRSWAAKTAVRIFSAVFTVFMIVGCCVAVFLFATAISAPSRVDILTLLMWLFNGGMGVHFVLDSISERRRAPARRKLEEAIQLASAPRLVEPVSADPVGAAVAGTLNKPPQI
ncbi:MAG: hypothetical protein EON54_17700 [Alcaligenaceae bacterium]|nr:MAG: hypothetical protein EON54_17700 [Alcaligenaceae bacterium]